MSEALRTLLYWPLAMDNVWRSDEADDCQTKVGTELGNYQAISVAKYRLVRDIAKTSSAVTYISTI